MEYTEVYSGPNQTSKIELSYKYENCQLPFQKAPLYLRDVIPGNNFSDLFWLLTIQTKKKNEGQYLSKFLKLKLNENTRKKIKLKGPNYLQFMCFCVTFWNCITLSIFLFCTQSSSRPNVLKMKKKVQNRKCSKEGMLEREWFKYLMKVYINPGIRKLLLLGGHGWGKKNE